MTEYVVGFMFEADNVALIAKSRPKWQKGRMNGIGGHIELDETPWEAMEREFVEETGYPEPVAWHRFVVLSGKEFRVYFFWADGDLSKVKTTTDEEIVVVPTFFVNTTNSIPNLTWLIPMAKSMRYDSADEFSISEVNG